MKLLAKVLKGKTAPRELFIHCVAHFNEILIKDESASSLLDEAQILCEALYDFFYAFLSRDDNNPRRVN